MEHACIQQAYIDRLEEKISKLETEIAVAKENIGVVKGDIQMMKSDIKEMRVEVNKGFEAVNIRINSGLKGIEDNIKATNSKWLWTIIGLGVALVVVFISKLI